MYYGVPLIRLRLPALPDLDNTSGGIVYKVDLLYYYFFGNPRKFFIYKGGKLMKNKKLSNLVITAILVAVAIVVDIITSSIPGLNLRMPFGGSLFGLSMIPLVLIGLMFGLKYGLLGGLVYALYNFTFDYLVYLSSLTWLLGLGAMSVIGVVLLDYLIPFTAFGLSGLFYKDNLKNGLNIIKAVTLVSAIRFLSSTLAGVLLWSGSITDAASNNEKNIAVSIYNFVGNNILLYSAVYNFIYIFTTGLVSIIILLISRKSLETIVDTRLSSVS